MALLSCRRPVSSSLAALTKAFKHDCELHVHDSCMCLTWLAYCSHAVAKHQSLPYDRLRQMAPYNMVSSV